MSYGIKVLDPNNATIFNSNNPALLAAHYFTCKGNVALPLIPEWVTGSDSRTQIGSSYTRQQQNVSYSAYSWPSGLGGTTTFHGVGSNYLAFDYDITPFPAAGQVMTIGSNEYKVTGSPTLANHTFTGGYDIYGFPILDYSNATHYIPFNQDMTSLRNSTANRTFKTYEYPNYGFNLYVRPYSSSYSGIIGYGHIGNLTTPLGILDSTGSTNNTFEVMVTVSGEAWGAISEDRTAKYLSGSTDYGISCVTGATERHTPNGPLVPFTTYDTRTRIAKIILAKGYGGGTAGTNSNFSLGSLSASSTKRWVRLDSCLFNKQNALVNWTGKYNWQSNNNISVAWRQYGGRFSLQSNFVTNLPYGVAEFGAGA